MHQPVQNVVDDIVNDKWMDISNDIMVDLGYQKYNIYLF